MWNFHIHRLMYPYNYIYPHTFRILHESMICYPNFTHAFIYYILVDVDI